METRLSNLLLKLSRMRSRVAGVLLLACLAQPSLAAEKIDTEFFEVGAALGIINVQDFTSELTWGFNATFTASEDFFLQFNYVSADVANSSVESGPQGAFTGDRNYQHFNLLLGYNLFQGEIFRGSNSGLSSLYAVAGVGDTEFLDESNFTYVLGLGYKLALSRRYMLNLDYRNYLYDSVAIDQEENTVLNSHFTVGLGWLF